MSGESLLLYYLNNGQQPLWMKEGIEAREKGKEFKY